MDKIKFLLIFVLPLTLSAIIFAINGYKKEATAKNITPAPSDYTNAQDSNTPADTTKKSSDIAFITIKE